MTLDATIPAPADGTLDAAARAVDLRKSYGSGDSEVRALDGVTVDFERGAFTAIMGPSGSGKSTLMHMLAALDTPSSGRVVVDGTEVGTLNDKALTALRRERIGFVFQAFNLIPTLTARENILLPLSLAGASPDQAWFDTVIDTVGLRDRLGHRPSEMSGGQQQRVAIARAVVGERRLILADEPTGALDSVTGEEILRLLRARCDAGAAGVLVTHEPRHAGWADRVVYLRDGLVVDESGAALAAGEGVNA